MGFKISESGGSWIVGQDGGGLSIHGLTISYEEYVKFKDHPDKVAEKYERRGGKIVAKVKPKDLK